MEVLFIIVGVVMFIILLIFINDKLSIRNRKSKSKDWKIGDKLVLERGSSSYRTLKSNNKSFAILKGWSASDIYINAGDGLVTKICWSELDFNKSAIWRKNFKEAESFMGIKPAFNVNIEESSVVGDSYEGVVIATMSEVECEVFLKKALKEEKYEIAEMIKKRMEKFR